jgi:hypothetical protein
MNENKIKYNLYCHFSNYDYKLFNSFIYHWESDFFAISKSGYSMECEIKISKSDFKADFNKIIYNGQKKHDFLLDSNLNYKPNKFYFACPEGLIGSNEIDEKYGLIYINQSITIIKEAKFLHKEKILNNIRDIRKLLDKFCYRNIELRKRLEIYDWDIKY